VLDDRIIKKYLMMKYLRPGTMGLSRSNILIRRSHSKFLTNKSNSPVKRRELYEAPAARPEKPRIQFKEKK
jgi:hypothetical protein